MQDENVNHEGVHTEMPKSITNNFVTPNANRKRCIKMSEKFDSSIRKTLVRDSTQITNFESPVLVPNDVVTNKQSSHC
jgi:hypothetical protein